MANKKHWAKVRASLDTAKGIGWDGCHKIYVLLDDAEMTKMREYGYDPLLEVTDPEEAFATLRQWWRDSCGLRFIQSVVTNEKDPNAGFTNLIPQGA